MEVIVFTATLILMLFISKDGSQHSLFFTEIDSKVSPNMGDFKQVIEENLLIFNILVSILEKPQCCSILKSGKINN